MFLNDIFSTSYYKLTKNTSISSIKQFSDFPPIPGELWQFHARADEGERTAEQESLVRTVDARTIQLQGPCGRLSQRFPWE